VILPTPPRAIRIIEEDTEENPINSSDSENFEIPYDIPDLPQHTEDFQPDSLNDKLRKAREVYLQLVKEAISESGCDLSISEPPVFENMSDVEMESELHKYGFIFRNRNSAISKLSRIWAALEEKPPERKSNDLVEFLKKDSAFYEDIITYHPVPIAALYRELTENGINVKLSKLKAILSQEGVAFDETK